MKKIVCSLLCTISPVIAWQYMTFDEAMKKDMFQRSIASTKSIIEMDGVELYSFFKDLYDQNNLSVVEQRQAQIPKIIHQIWLGSDVPEAFIELQRSWI